jgi:class 3 adenylate cyclase/tetratricopeptide (TPR) repeat protein
LSLPQEDACSVLTQDSERRLAAILALDVVGYSRLMSEDEAGTFATLKAHRTEFFQPTVAEHKGRIIKLMGDGALVEFSSVVDAVACAVAVQEGMVARNEGVPEDRKMLLRLGVNLGDVIVEDDDIYGTGVNVASRLETLAEPGGIWISGTVYDQVAGTVSRPIEDMGEQALKNIEDPVRAYRILAGETAAGAHARPASGPASLEFAPRERPSIAILPFKNLSGDPAQDYLAEGLRLGILSSLIQLSGLFLITTNAVNGYRGQDVPAARAGREVGVRYVLDGAVQQAGNRIRATLQLTDVQTGEFVWAERYDRVLDDLFKMQDEITQEVIISLDVRLLGREGDRIWFNKLTSPKARELWLRGISHLYAGTKDDNATAQRIAEELHQVQPDTMHGVAIVALTHWLDVFFGWTGPDARSSEQATEWAEKAIQYEDNNGFGHIVLGHLQLLEGRHDEALENCRIATALRSSCPFAHGLLASAQNFCGDSQGAIANAREALQIERIYPPWMINVLAAAYRDDGKVDLSIPAAQEAARLDPEQTEARIILCSDYELKNAHDEARRLASEIVAIDPSFRLSSYAESQPYKNAATRERLIESLRAAGLPE